MRVALTGIPERPIAFDQRLVGTTLGPSLASWTEQDTILYALSVGATAEDHLAYVYEALGPRVLPCFGSLASTALFLATMTAWNVDMRRLLHASEETVVHRSLKPAGDAWVTRRCAGIWDKGSDAIVVWENELYDSEGPLVTSTTRSYVRDGGGFGGSRGPLSGSPFTAARDADLELQIAVPRNAALFFRLLGDHNALHVDPEFAARAGFGRPILHGLCTYGMAALALGDAVTDGNPDRVSRFDCRFQAPVMPDAQLTVRGWLNSPGQASFDVVDASGVPVLGGGRIDWLCCA